MDREIIENLSSIKKVSRWIKQLLKNYRECNKKQPKGLENTNMNAIKHAMQPKIQKTF